MDRHVVIVSIATRVAGIVLGVVSLSGLVTAAIAEFDLQRARSISIDPNLDIGKYGIVGMLQNSANGFGYVFRFFAGIGVWAVAVIAVLLVIALVFAAILYFAGLGIAHHAMWARILTIVGAFGIVVLFGPALLWALGTQHYAVAALVGPIILAALYVAWALIWRFRSPPYQASA